MKNKKKKGLMKAWMITFSVLLVIALSFGNAGLVLADSEDQPAGEVEATVSEVIAEAPAPAAPAEPTLPSDPAPEVVQEDIVVDDGVVDEPDAVIEEEVVEENDELLDVDDNLLLVVPLVAEIGQIEWFWIESSNGHCQTFGGNGNVVVSNFPVPALYPFMYIGETEFAEHTWKLMRDDCICTEHSPGNPGCGHNEWFCYSNQSGEALGANIQMTHRGPEPPTPFISVVIPGEKRIIGQLGNSDVRDFSFTAVQINSANPNSGVKAGGLTGSASTNGAGTFSISVGPLEPGTYYFLVSEDQTGDGTGGWTYDKAQFVVQVVVTLSSDKTKAVPSVTVLGCNSGIVFTNKYVEPPVPYIAVVIPGNKVVTGDTPSYLPQFNFKLTLVSTEPANLLPAGFTVYADKIGAGDFYFGLGNLTEGKYNFIAEEVMAGISGWTFDASKYAVCVEVFKDDEGDLDSDITCLKDAKNVGSKVVFTNTYKKTTTTTVITDNPTPKASHVPKTGDPGVGIWNALAIIAVIGLVGFTYGFVRLCRRETT